MPLYFPPAIITQNLQSIPFSTFLLQSAKNPHSPFKTHHDDDDDDGPANKIQKIQVFSHIFMFFVFACPTRMSCWLLKESSRQQYNNRSYSFFLYNPTCSDVFPLVTFKKHILTDEQVRSEKKTDAKDYFHHHHQSSFTYGFGESVCSLQSQQNEMPFYYINSLYTTYSHTQVTQDKKMNIIFVSSLIPVIIIR